jgi:hypothetical protein
LTVPNGVKRARRSSSPISLCRFETWILAGLSCSRACRIHKYAQSSAGCFSNIGVCEAISISLSLGTITVTHVHHEFLVSVPGSACIENVASAATWRQATYPQGSLFGGNVLLCLRSLNHTREAANDLAALCHSHRHRLLLLKLNVRDTFGPTSLRVLDDSHVCHMYDKAMVRQVNMVD